MMTSTSEERREVAERLRGLDAKITSRDTPEGAVDKLMEAVYGERTFSPVRYSVRNLCGLGYALADLIDPTCHVVTSSEGILGCDRCHTVMLAVRAKPSFCPNCGARVVSADAE